MSVYYNIATWDSLRGSSVRIGTVERRLARPLRKDDTHKSRSVNKTTGARFGSVLSVSARFGIFGIDNPSMLRAPTPCYGPMNSPLRFKNLLESSPLKPGFAVCGFDRMSRPGPFDIRRLSMFRYRYRFDPQGPELVLD